MDNHVCLICGIECKSVPCLGCERNELRLRLEIAVATIKKISLMQSPQNVADEAIEILGLKDLNL